MQETTFATGSENEVREIREILEGLPFMIHSFKEAGLISDPEGSGVISAENVPIKAEAVYALRPDVIVMSDDSDLSVDHLNDKPGIFSTRWLGRDTLYTEKNAELIRCLEGVEEDVRSACSIAAIACIPPDGTQFLTEAHVEERVAKASAGEDGFGYSPILYLPEYGKCSIELSGHEKNVISRRDKALRQMQEKLWGIYADTVDEGV